jgi:hypothetical protein
MPSSQTPQPLSASLKIAASSGRANLKKAHQPAQRLAESPLDRKALANKSKPSGVSSIGDQRLPAAASRFAVKPASAAGLIGRDHVQSKNWSGIQWHKPILL